MPHDQQPLKRTAREQRGRPFQPGRSGNPLGRPKGRLNNATREAREFCTSVVDDPSYQRAIRERALAGTLPPAVECMLWHYAYGKPKESVGHSGQLRISWLKSE